MTSSLSLPSFASLASLLPPLKRSPAARDRYAVIIDAGSSGSRAYVYRWEDVTYSQRNAKNSNRLVPVDFDDDWNFKIHPGISTYANKVFTQDELWHKHLKQLIEHAENIIPEAERPFTPIFFLATAGMRMVEENERRRLLELTCSTLREKTSFNLPDCASHVQVIDGETEGLYGWLALNYLLGATTKETETFGFMDMGGASTQIAFVPKKSEIDRHIDDLMSVNLRLLDGREIHWHLFVTTWLGFGANEARAKLLTKTLASGSNLDPCTQPDAVIEVASPPNSARPGNVTISGTGNFTQCMESLYHLLQKDLPCKDDPCLFNGVHVPTIDFKENKFVGISEYWYTANDVFQMGGKYDFEKYEKKVREFCEMPWSKVEENQKKGKYNGMSLEQLQNACFKSSWVLNVLHEGFGVPIDVAMSGMARLVKRGCDYTEAASVSHGVNNLIARDFEQDGGNSTAPASAPPLMTIQTRETPDFSDPFQSALKINGEELSWTLGRALFYASSQVPPFDKSHSLPVGFQAADSTEFIYGGEQLPVSSIDIGQVSVIFFFVVLVLFGLRHFMKYSQASELRRIRSQLSLGKIPGSSLWCHLPWLKNKDVYSKLESQENGTELDDGSMFASAASRPTKQYPMGLATNSLSSLNLSDMVSRTPHEFQSGASASATSSQVPSRVPSRVASRVSMREDLIRTKSMPMF